MGNFSFNAKHIIVSGNYQLEKNSVVDVHAMSLDILFSYIEWNEHFLVLLRKKYTLNLVRETMMQKNGGQ